MEAKRSAATDVVVTLAALLALVVLLLVTIGATMNGGPRVLFASLTVFAAATALRVWRGRLETDPGSTTGRVRRLAVGLVQITAVATIASVGSALWLARPPSDASMERRFREHRDELERLRDMVLEDALAGVSADGREFAREAFRYGSAIEAGLDPARAAEYRRLLRELECARVDVWSPGDVHCLVGGFGFGSRGWRASLAWREHPPAEEERVESLEGIGSTGARWVYRPLEGSWYIGFIW